MKRVVFIAYIFLTTFVCSCEVVQAVIDQSLQTSTPLTEGEVTSGLKKALDIGLKTSVKNASASGGYLQNELIKILLPPQVKELQEKIETEKVLGVPLSTIYGVYVQGKNGGNDLFDELITSMNKGAEKAAGKAGPIFLGALQSMSISDAFSILNGNE
ncbi:MAG: DUF4197 family protein, partial [Bacteroidota bacterium]